MPECRRAILAMLLAGAALTAPAAEDPRALMLTARSLQFRGGGEDPKTAVLLYRKVITLVPDSAEAHLRLSESLQEAEDPEAAVAPAEKAVALAPQNAEAQAHLGLLLSLIHI